MNHLTRVLLVLLRLAIGWHLFVEGVTKLQSVQHGQSLTNRPWSSRNYLANATGPFAEYFRALANDLDAQAVEWLRLPQPPTPWSAAPGMSPRAQAAWDNYFRQFVKLHGGPPANAAWFQAVFQAWKKQQGIRKKPIALPLIHGPAIVELTFVERVRRWQNKCRELAQLQAATSAFGKKVNREQIASLRAEIRRERDVLLSELDQEARGLADLMAQAWLASSPWALFNYLTPLTINLNSAGGVAAICYSNLRQIHLQSALPKQPFELGASVEPPPSLELQVADAVVRWGLTLSGLGLLLGLLTRTCCAFAAALLTLFYLAMPPWPGLPTNPLAEGTYLFVNKTLIEALALAVLATTCSGRWLGIDGLLHPAISRFWEFARRKWYELVAAEAAVTQRL
jgi:uncharacterized membrane protein YphA (DoxX/SURF4 family)